jgi:protein tyrosine phosphatase (PTP) superfamily phosphohydrolase (DUF442 family)
MRKRLALQAVVDVCLLPLALAREVVRRHNPFGHENRSSFARRRWFGGIRKFALVNPEVCIGSTPTMRGLKRLKKHGVRTIVNLRASYDYRDAAESLGFRYIAIPLNGRRPPAQEQITEFLRVVEATENLPVFFHCNRARNRTYMLLGLYRVARDGWGAGQAVAEMNHFGWKNIPESVVSFIESFANGGLAELRARATS